MEQGQLTERIHMILKKISESRQIPKSDIEFLLDWMKKEVRQRRLMHLLEIFSRVESDAKELPSVLTQAEALTLISPVKR
ncbi:MAG: GGDEF domain-containing protein, partial [Exiguobacterium sp.]